MIDPRAGISLTTQGSPRQRPPARLSDFLSLRLRGCQLLPKTQAGMPSSVEPPRQTDASFREQEDHRDKQSPQKERPEIREGSGQDAPGPVDADGPQDRSDQGTAPPDRHPNHHLERRQDTDLRRSDDAHLRDIERAGEPSQRRRRDKNKQLVATRGIPGEEDSLLA